MKLASNRAPRTQQYVTYCANQLENIQSLSAHKNKTDEVRYAIVGLP